MKIANWWKKKGVKKGPPQSDLKINEIEMNWIELNKNKTIKLLLNMNK